MRVLIIYDAAYPNTRSIAKAIAAGFANQNDLAYQSAEKVDPKALSELETLIVGSPSLSRKPSPLISDLLKNLPKKSMQSVAVTAFDTRSPRRSLSEILFGSFFRKKGHAADHIDKILIQKGGIQVLPPEGFYARSSKGLLYQNEQKRAMEWGREIEILCP
jgi:flavodoxin